MVTVLFMLIVSVLALIPETSTMTILGGVSRNGGRGLSGFFRFDQNANSFRNILQVQQAALYSCQGLLNWLAYSAHRLYSLCEQIHSLIRISRQGFILELEIKSFLLGCTRMREAARISYNP